MKLVKLKPLSLEEMEFNAPSFFVTVSEFLRVCQNFSRSMGEPSPSADGVSELSAFLAYEEAARRNLGESEQQFRARRLKLKAPECLTRAVASCQTLNGAMRTFYGVVDIVQDIDAPGLPFRIRCSGYWAKDLDSFNSFDMPSELRAAWIQKYADKLADEAVFKHVTQMLAQKLQPLQGQKLTSSTRDEALAICKQVLKSLDVSTLTPKVSINSVGNLNVDLVKV